MTYIITCEETQESQLHFLFSTEDFHKQLLITLKLHSTTISIHYGTLKYKLTIIPYCKERYLDFFEGTCFCGVS